jgi:hypothetical protein
MIQNCLSCKLIDKMNVMFARPISAGIVSCTTVMQEDHKKTMNTAKYFHVGPMWGRYESSKILKIWLNPYLRLPRMT